MSNSFNPYQCSKEKMKSKDNVIFLALKISYGPKAWLEKFLITLANCNLSHAQCTAIISEALCKSYRPLAIVSCDMQYTFQWQRLSHGGVDWVRDVRPHNSFPYHLRSVTLYTIKSKESFSSSHYPRCNYHHDDSNVSFCCFFCVINYVLTLIIKILEVVIYFVYTEEEIGY